MVLALAAALAVGAATMGTRDGVLGALGYATVDVAVATPPTGFVSVAPPGMRFSIALPEGYRQVELTPEVLNRILEEAAADNPGFAAMVDAYAGMDAGIELLAVDPATGDSVVVQRVRDRRMSSLDDVSRENIPAQFAAAGVEGVTEQRLALPAGEAVELRYRSVDGVTPGARQYYLAGDSLVWIITLTPGNSDSTGVLDLVASSFRHI